MEQRVREKLLRSLDVALRTGKPLSGKYLQAVSSLLNQIESPPLPKPNPDPLGLGEKMARLRESGAFSKPTPRAAPGREPTALSTRVDTAEPEQADSAESFDALEERLAAAEAKRVALQCDVRNLKQQAQGI